MATEQCSYYDAQPRLKRGDAPTVGSPLPRIPSRQAHETPAQHNRGSDAAQRRTALTFDMNGYDMTTANKTQAFAVLNTFATARTELIAGMKAAGYTLETARDVVIEWACEKTGAAYNVKASGKVTLDTSHRKYEAAKTVVRDVMHMMAGTTRRAASAKKETDAVAQLAAKVAKLSAADKKRLFALLAA